MLFKGIDIKRLFFTILILGATCSSGKPLNQEDVESLLPATPQTTNDTLVAIVQDSVVKDAVQNALGNGSLSGLVVKKNVVILPANAPDMVLTHTEQILTVPPDHLEDIRKNITNDLQTELGSTQTTYLNQWIIKDDYSEPGSESSWSGQKNQSDELPQDNINSQNILSENMTNVEPIVQLPEGLVTQRLELPEELGDNISVPIVAVLDPSKNVDDKVESSIVALLSNKTETSSSLANQLQFLDNNREEIKREVERSVQDLQIQLDLSRENEPQVLNDAKDLEVAEDIVFRPLFRYRQEAQHRTNYGRSNNNNYRRYSYDRYDNYDNNYNRQYYRNRPEYYNDY